MNKERPKRYFVQCDAISAGTAHVFVQMDNYRYTLQIHFPSTDQHFLEGAPEGAFRFMDAPYQSPKDEFGNEVYWVAFSARKVDELIPASTLAEACEIFFKRRNISNYQVLHTGDHLPEIE